MKGKGVGSSRPAPRPQAPPPARPLTFTQRLDNVLGSGNLEDILQVIISANDQELINERNHRYRYHKNVLVSYIDTELRKRGFESLPVLGQELPRAAVSMPFAPSEIDNENDDENLIEAEEVKEGSGLGKKNAWIEHCKKYQQKHNCSWKEAMIRAKATYKKGAGSPNLDPSKVYKNPNVVYNMGGNIKFPNGLTKEQMEAYKAKGQYVSNGRWMQLQNGKYTWWPSKTGSGSQMSSFMQTYNPVESILNFITYITEETNHIIRQQDLEHYSDEELYNLYENLLNSQLPNIVSSEVDWDHVFDIVENMLLERGVLETEEESIENMLLDSGVIDPTSVTQMNENISRSTRTGGFIVDPKTGRMYHDNDPKAQKWKK
jgi:hypothetical protein